MTISSILLAEAKTLGEQIVNIDPPIWQNQHAALLKKAKFLTNKYPNRPAAWFVAACCYWVDVDAEMDDCHSLPLLRTALQLDPQHIPSLLLGTEITEFLGMVYDDEKLLDEAVKYSEKIEIITHPHPGGIALVKYSYKRKEFILSNVFPRTFKFTDEDYDAMNELMKELSRQNWDGVTICS